VTILRSPWVLWRCETGLLTASASYVRCNRDRINLRGKFMSRDFSTRLDEDPVRSVDRFVKQKSLHKKGLIEQALLSWPETFEFF